MYIYTCIYVSPTIPNPLEKPGWSLGLLLSSGLGYGQLLANCAVRDNTHHGIRPGPSSRKRRWPSVP